MKVTLESTTKIVDLHIRGASVPARIWHGKTESGIRVHAYITRIAAATDEDLTEFERELEDRVAPTPEIEAIPARLIL